MSNLLKSKFLLGIMIVAVAVAGLAMFAVTANAQQANVSASDIQYAATVRTGSSGQAVIIWQKFFNDYSSANLVADGAFGPLTNAAARNWQTARGLMVDGILGPMSRAAAMAQIGAGPAMPSTGPCSGGATFNYMTGAACVTTGLPAGCTSTAGWSPINGMKCDSTTPAPSPSGPLTGGAGDITVTDSNAYTNEDVEEGESDVEILEFSVEADDESDVEITSIKVSFVNGTDVTPDPNSSLDLDDYAESVSVWFDGEMVGEADVDDFSENSDVWTKSISLDGVIIRAGEEEDIVVAISAINVIDSSDTTNDDWSVDVTSVRFEDAEGVVTTENNATVIQDFDFVPEGDDEDLNLKSSSSDPDASSLLVDDTNESDWYKVFVFNLEAENSDIALDDLVLTVTTVNGDYDEFVSDVMIKIDGEEFDDFAVVDAGTASADLTFDIDQDFTIDADDTVAVEVWIEFLATDGATFLGDGTETVEVRTVSVSGEGADDVTDTATIIGEAHTLSLSPATVSDTDSTVTVDDPNDSGVISWEFTVSADEDDVTFAVAVNAAVDGTTDDIRFTISGTDTTIATSGLTLISGDAAFAGGVWTINEGDDATFALDTTFTEVDAADDGVYRIRLDSVAGVSVDEISGPLNLSF